MNEAEMYLEQQGSRRWWGRMVGVQSNGVWSGLGKKSTSLKVTERSGLFY